MRFGWRFVLIVAAAALALACTSPTLPLPPPAAPTETAGAEPNTYVLSGAGAIPSAFLVVYDANPPAGANPINGTVVGQDGKWSVTITANKGDVVEIWEESGGEQTSAINFKIE